MTIIQVAGGQGAITRIFPCPLGVVSLFGRGSPIPLIILEITPYEGASRLALGVPRIGVKGVYTETHATNTETHATNTDTHANCVFTIAANCSTYKNAAVRKLLNH